MPLHSKLYNIRQRFQEAAAYNQKIPKDASRFDTDLITSYAQNKSFFDKNEFLVRYFISSFLAHCDEFYTRCYFAGACSRDTKEMDAIEGCTRMLPFLALALKNQHSLNTKDLDDNDVDLQSILKTCFICATNPEHTAYWGKPRTYQQIVCEAADVALALWISKEQVWHSYSDSEQQQILHWLEQMLECEVVDNNWHLFAFTIQTVIANLTGSELKGLKSYTRIKEFYVGDGWFSDGEGEKFDYYNSWAFHYSLFWLQQINKNLDPDFITSSNAAFCSTFKYFFSREGMPFFGRSACYRLAAPTALLAGAQLSKKADSYNYGNKYKESSAIFDSVWSHFIAKGSIENGIPTQGYYKENLNFLDAYSGPGSSLWCLRSLNLLLWDFNTFIEHHEESYALPSESNFKPIIIEAIDAKLYKDGKGDILMHWLKRPYLPAKVKHQSTINKLKEFYRKTPKRPTNNHIKNRLQTYSTQKPYTEL
ncbi:DUF2264 domain-containing protein [Agaribacterium sp. ZY112]|uniref:DUF2264 domain-containing protein n=1 Tax=Agaribacterium sp. ZY112 TaxID=3233574 RepID=UPI0035246CCB